MSVKHKSTDALLKLRRKNMCADSATQLLQKQQTQQKCMYAAWKHTQCGKKY